MILAIILPAYFTILQLCSKTGNLRTIYYDQRSSGEAISFDRMSTKFAGKAPVLPLSRQNREDKPDEPVSDIRHTIDSRSMTTKGSKSTTPIIQRQWRANFMVSKRTQARIIDSAWKNQHFDPVDRAIQVLQTLLRETSPFDCNESNVVCALTLSAKTMAEVLSSSLLHNIHDRKKKPRRSMQNAEVKDTFKQIKFRELLFETILIAYRLIIENRMSSRQLANVVWAIAKHYSRDPMILPIVDFDLVEVSEEYHDSRVGNLNKGLHRQPLISKSERLHLHSTDGMNERETIVAKTVDEICRRLNEILEKRYDTVDCKSNEVKAKRNLRDTLNMMEITMSVWAFAIFYPRDRPPGWELPARILKVARSDGQSSSFSTSSYNTTADWITYEQKK